MKKQKIVFLTGAGISAESGIATFRDSDGLWENYNVMDVCSAAGFRKNPELVHQFYNDRRDQLLQASPNSAHSHIAELENIFDVTVVTQNIDNLHELAGSSNVIHLHGELMKVRATDNDSIIFQLHQPNVHTSTQTLINGHHVRPHIVFFQEPVPMIETAAQIVAQADILVIIGTSLNVYPAAGLIHYARPNTKIFYIDPAPAAVPASVNVIPLTATAGMTKLKALL